jgi:hypothetical protein
MLGDMVTVSKELGDELTIITGRISGIVLKDTGDLRYFYIKGLDTALWLSDGWKFEDEIDDEGEEND